MQCVTPLFRLYDITTNQTIRIIPRSEVMQGLELDPNNIRFQLSKMNARYLARNQLIQTVPCRNCWACNLTESAEWATRNMLETLDHDHCYFITLTYDDEHLPILKHIDFRTVKDGEEITEIIENDGTWTTGSLYPDDVTKFLKSLKEYYRTKFGITGIRYFYCGEYGEKTQRPHYHMLLYGAPLDLSQNYDYHIDPHNFKEHWKNPIIDRFWEHGMHDIANVEWSNAAYVARYCSKKLNKEPCSDRWYAEHGKYKEFIRMSRRPGIGIKYYERHKFDIYKNDSMVMKTVKGNIGSFKPPKAFDKLFKEEFPEEFAKIEKKRQECAERARHNEYRSTDRTDLEKLKTKAENVATKMSMLPREGEW